MILVLRFLTVVVHMLTCPDMRTGERLDEKAQIRRLIGQTIILKTAVEREKDA